MFDPWWAERCEPLFLMGRTSEPGSTALNEQSEFSDR